MNLTKILQLGITIGLLLVQPAAAETLSLSLKETKIHDVMMMLSKQQRVNIFLGDGVDGDVTVNLYNMETIDAIYAIAEAAGFAVEERNNSFFIVNREDAGKFSSSIFTEVRAFKIQYTNPSDIEAVLKEHLSSYGTIKTLRDNKLVVVEDLPGVIQKIDKLVLQLDREPKQIMIEAKILEITLTDNQSFGLDWTKLFDSADGTGSFGIQGLATPNSPGLFAQFTNDNVDLVLGALKERGRLRTLSTPKLLAMEDRQAETQIGTQIGFKVTTTSNQVTQESIEFLETGIILKVTASVDRNGRILLDIHPEVSAGTVSDDGVPSKTTTELSTQMLVPNGKTVFMGGLIRRSANNSREGVPGLGDVPLIGPLFSNDSKNVSTTEIVVLLTPTIIDFNQADVETEAIIKVDAVNRLLGDEEERIDAEMSDLMDDDEEEQFDLFRTDNDL
ncbi:MAG: hypothetical protein QNJ69_09460 [Gammaproteobacteria bacterium]|nr:hypothetical protein [Gammaproteobacteria bacterium]